MSDFNLASQPTPLTEAEAGISAMVILNTLLDCYESGFFQLDFNLTDEEMDEAHRELSLLRERHLPRLQEVFGPPKFRGSVHLRYNEVVS